MWFVFGDSHFVFFYFLKQTIDSSSCYSWGGNIRRYATSAFWLQQVTKILFLLVLPSYGNLRVDYFGFCSTPFELHDDNYVLKAMKFCERPRDEDADALAIVPVVDRGESSSMPNIFKPQAVPPPPSRANLSVRPPTSPPLPGILKARVKHEH